MGYGTVDFVTDDPHVEPALPKTWDFVGVLTVRLEWGYVKCPSVVVVFVGEDGVQLFMEKVHVCIGNLELPDLPE